MHGTDRVEVVGEVSSHLEDEELVEDLDAHLRDGSVQFLLLETPRELKNIRKDRTVDTASESQEELEVLLCDLASEALVALAAQLFQHFAGQVAAVLHVLVVVVLS